MPKHHAAAITLDHTHCRAICDEIGERLAQMLDRDILEMPPRLRTLLNKLAQLERNQLMEMAHAPSIAPSIGEMSLPPFHESVSTA